MEAKLQAKIIVWLKVQGAFVIKTKPGPGTPVGTPDILAFFKDRWAAIEVKASESAPFRLGQRSTLDRLATGNVNVYIVFPENWEKAQQNLLKRFFQNG